MEQQTTQDAALDRLTRQAGAGIDSTLSGEPSAQSALLAAFASRTADQFTIVPVKSPAASLSLSSLIAQLSGRTDLDGHDDSVLESGFRRLATPVDGKRTVLVLDVPVGLQRPALRYLQHVGRSAPMMTMAVTGGPELDAALAEIGLRPLANRLQAEPPILLGAAVPALRVDAPPLLPVVPQRRRSGAGVFVLAATGMAASLAFGLWLGRATGDTVPGRSRDFAMQPTPTVQSAPSVQSASTVQATPPSTMAAATPAPASSLPAVTEPAVSASEPEPSQPAAEAVAAPAPATSVAVIPVPPAPQPAAEAAATPAPATSVAMIPVPPAPQPAAEAVATPAPATSVAMIPVPPAPQPAPVVAPVPAPSSPAPTHLATLPEPTASAPAASEPAATAAPAASATGFALAEPKPDRIPLPPPAPALPPLIAHQPPARAQGSRQQAANQGASPARLRPVPPSEPAGRRWARWPEEREPEPYPSDAHYAYAPDRPFVGTYVTGPYGNRVFQYDQR